MKLMNRYRRNESYHARKNGKEFQVGLRFEDGTASYPKKCTVIIDGNEATVDIGEGDDRIKKAVKAGAEKLGYKIVESKKSESMEGWDDWEEIEGLEDALYNIEDLAYELRSCVRGANTNCKTWAELSKYVVRLADALRGAGEDLKYKQDEEDESKKSEGVEDDAIQMFKGVAKACGVSDRVTVSANNGKIYFTLRLNLEGLDEYVFEYDPTMQFIRCVAAATGDSSTGSRKKFNSLDDASDWLKENVEALLDVEKEARELLGLSEGLEDQSEERMSYAELKADALKRIGEGPFADEDDLDDSIMSTLDAMPYDIPEGVKQSLGSDLFEILYDKIEEA